MLLRLITYNKDVLKHSLVFDQHSNLTVISVSLIRYNIFFVVMKLRLIMYNKGVFKHSLVLDQHSKSTLELSC